LAVRHWARLRGALVVEAVARYSLVMIRILILLLLVVCSIAAADVVYRWVDENGQVNYSDRPHEDAEEVTLPDAQTFSTPVLPSRRSANVQSSRDQQRRDDEADAYRSVEIVSPTPNQVLWNTGGLLKVSVSVQPQLRRGDTVMIFLDGKMVEGLGGNKRDTELTEVYRGEHTLRAEVRSAGGSVVANGNAVTFTVMQTSIQNPNNPNAPSAPIGPGPGR